MAILFYTLKGLFIGATKDDILWHNFFSCSERNIVFVELYKHSWVRLSVVIRNIMFFFITVCYSLFVLNLTRKYMTVIIVTVWCQLSKTVSAGLGYM